MENLSIYSAIRRRLPHPGLRLLIGPIALMLSGFALRAAAPAVAARLGLAPDGSLALTFRDLAGICGWLALAWTGARVFDILIMRAALAARRPGPYPRLLGDLVRAVFFAAAGAAILMLVSPPPGSRSPLSASRCATSSAISSPASRSASIMPSALPIGSRRRRAAPAASRS